MDRGAHSPVKPDRHRLCRLWFYHSHSNEIGHGQIYYFKKPHSDRRFDLHILEGKKSFVMEATLQHNDQKVAGHLSGPEVGEGGKALLLRMSWSHESKVGGQGIKSLPVLPGNSRKKQARFLLDLGQLSANNLGVRYDDSQKGRLINLMLPMLSRSRSCYLLVRWW